jgi:hypothetical protein
MRLNLATVLNLPQLRADACRRVEAKAEAARLQHLTPGSGQARAYERKRAQAELVTALPKVDPSSVPLVAGEAEINGVSLVDMASIIIKRAEETDAALDVIELERVKAKKAIRAASSPAEIEAAESSFNPA